MNLSSQVIKLYESLPTGGRPLKSNKLILESVLIETVDYRLNQSHPETSEFKYVEGRYRIRLYIHAEPTDSNVLNVKTRIAKANRQKIINEAVNYMIKIDGYDPLIEDDFLKIKPLWSFLFKKSYTNESKDSQDELLRDFKFIVKTIKSKGTIGTKLLMSKGWTRLMGSQSLQQILDGLKD